jgi:hypothetical protein
MAQWKLDIFPGLVAQEGSSHFEILRMRCRPCVFAAYFRILWNSVPTSARMRTMKGHCGTQPCKLGYVLGEDRIEHYLACTKVWEALGQIPPRGCGFRPQWRSLIRMIMLGTDLTDDDRFSIAVSCYAVAWTIHDVSQHVGRLQPEGLLRLHANHGSCGVRDPRDDGSDDPLDLFA